MREISTAKRPTLFLNVHVIEARDVEAKDIDGFSDPYCILGIIPDGTFSADCLSQTTGIGSNTSDGNAQTTEVSKSNLENARPQSSRPTLNRLSKSLLNRRTTSENTSVIERKRLSVKDLEIPVKLMRSTKVISNTLNPVWNEYFQFELDDVNKDLLHLDIWDHDEETSVIDAVCSLNEVRGVKQLGRYFKQVSQSARKGQSGDLDDFLGCITIELRNVPFEETHYWLKLKGRTMRSKVQGEIHIGLSITAREQGDEQARLTEIKEHIQITYFFISQELKHLKVRSISQYNLLTRLLLKMPKDSQIFLVILFYLNIMENGFAMH
ncbi:hypothetical protein EG68_01335 [Paragonimus skrjabini miyazakii]|uniref:C2 domain-containing protein n=1 Tax=Paragonimus skrjabini miyazakii TaxID=59628 RepID=A0A8S9ZB46_9TREM|nr:hypothetical protein EG68_01335 [Paragonimus skrjabini miyazakii]